MKKKAAGKKIPVKKLTDDAGKAGSRIGKRIAKTLKGK